MAKERVGRDAEPDGGEGNGGGAKDAGKRRSILSALAAKFARGGATRRIHVCVGPDCCRKEDALAAIARIEATLASSPEGAAVKCTKSGCLGVCGSGPIAFVQPEGTWYRELTPGAAERVAREHLLGGRVAEPLAFDPPPDAKPPV